MRCEIHYKLHEVICSSVQLNERRRESEREKEEEERKKEFDLIE